MKHFVYGMDTSSLPRLEEAGLQAFKEKDLLTTLADHGVRCIRLRLWLDPYDESGHPYGGGTNDLKTTLAFAKRIQEAGFDILLDFHYSDFWADPGKQIMPKAWVGLSHNQLIDVIERYTSETLMVFKNKGIEIKYIQTGNEITNGMLWPDAKLYDNDVAIAGGFMRLSDLLIAANKACRAIYPRAEIIIHLDRGGDKQLYEHWFKQISDQLNYDVIGLSYYPYWHGSLASLEANILTIKGLFAKKVMVMETAYAYRNELEGVPLVMTESRLEKKNDWPPYPFTKEGQAAFMADLINCLIKLSVDGLFYWEPAWLLASGDTWATEAGRRYINETHKKDGNEWVNQALFDLEGKANPALDVFKKLKGEHDEK